METIMAEGYVIGIDFGSDSVRSVVVEVRTGKVRCSGAVEYPRWKQGLYQHPEYGIFRQHPLDYLEALEKCVKDVTAALSAEEKSRIAGIGVDTTGSTPVPVNREGVPLALTEAFRENENAMFHLWKDHSAAAEAEELNLLFAKGSGTDYTKYQGRYSAEWFWAKILHCIRADETIREAAYTWEEHSDWIVGELCGRIRPEEIYHSACAAGHKLLWHSEWGGLPAADVLGKSDPYLAQVRERYGQAPQPAYIKAGTLTGKWAAKFGLPEGIAVSGSSFDAHAGAVGAGIRENNMVCILGTSAVDMAVGRAEKLERTDIREFGGQAENSILPGYVGIETGQAAFGDILAWFKNLLLWPLGKLRDRLDEKKYEELFEEAEASMLGWLQQEAEALPDYPFPISLDWFNGRRYPDTDDAQKAMVSHLTLGITAPVLYRSFVFGAVCGLKRIVDGLEKQKIEIDNVVAVGGISKKSDYIMQMMADVLDKTITILDADQTCALGAAVYAAVAAGLYPDASSASSAMAAKGIRDFEPDAAKHRFYETHYAKYLELARLAELQKEK